MIGQKLSPILSEIEDTILEHQVELGTKPQFTEEGFRASILIFSSTIGERISNLMENENFTLEDRCNAAHNFGNDLRKLIKTYTGIDTVELYKK